jgi:protein SCO1/2
MMRTAVKAEPSARPARSGRGSLRGTTWGSFAWLGWTVHNRRPAAWLGFWAWLAVAGVLLVTPAPAQRMLGDQGMAAQKLPPGLSNVGIDQKLDAQIPLDSEFQDEFGRTVKLGGYFNQHKPVVLALVYYECPMLCTEVLNGLSSTLRMMKFEMGKQYDVLTVSFDPKEKPELAAEKKRAYLQRYGRPGAQNYWHFLVGDEKNIRALTSAVGFKYQWDPEIQQYAHATGIIVLTPEGRVSKYFYGVEYSPKDLRLGLVEASQNRIGSLVDQVLLYCYHYDPRTGKYGAVVMNIVRLAGAATVVILGGLLIVLFKYDPQRKARRASSGRFWPGKRQPQSRAGQV